MFIFLDFDKWIQQCFHLHNTSQNSSLTRKYPLCMPFMVSTLGPPISGNHRYLCLYCFVFSRWSNIWNPTIFSLWGSSFFHLAKCIYFHPCCCMFLFYNNSFPFYGYAMVLCVFSLVEVFNSYESSFYNHSPLDFSVNIQSFAYFFYCFLKILFLRINCSLFILVVIYLLDTQISNTFS